jgi:hypothetical protein
MSSSRMAALHADIVLVAPVEGCILFSPIDFVLSQAF